MTLLNYLGGSFYTGLTNGATTTYTFDPTIGGDTGVIECSSPVNSSRLDNEMTRWTHEIRVASDFEILYHLGRFRLTGHGYHYRRRQD